MAQQQITPLYKKRTRAVKNLQDEINVLLKGIKDESKKKFAYWSEALGEKIAKVAVPVKNKKGILFVKVQDPSWRFELTRRKPEILILINDNLKKNKITDIVFI